jgi:hypothetical protein
VVLSIRPLVASGLLTSYNLAIAAVGFETRARYVIHRCGVTAKRQVALAFADRKEFAFQENLRFFDSSGFQVIECVDDSARSFVNAEITGAMLENEERALLVFVDISSLNRVRLAWIVHQLSQAASKQPIVVDFAYCLAKYSPPPDPQLSTNSFAGPVIPPFAGWTSNPDLPPVAVVGLGYEEGKALGAVEYLQADEVWAFDPASPEKKYRQALELANKLFLDGIPSSRVFQYDVTDPVALFGQLESLTSGLARVGRPHILPFGPKLFALVSLLVACQQRSVGVWRVSAGESEPAVDRLPSKHVICLQVTFASSRESLLELKV